MEQLSPLELFSSQHQTLLMQQQKIEKLKTELRQQESQQREEIVLKFVEVEKVLFQAKQRILGTLGEEYKQRSAEFDQTLGEIEMKMKRVKECKMIDSPEVKIPLSSVVISLDDFASVTNTVNSMDVVKTSPVATTTKQTAKVGPQQQQQHQQPPLPCQPLQSLASGGFPVMPVLASTMPSAPVKTTGTPKRVAAATPGGPGLQGSGQTTSATATKKKKTKPSASSDDALVKVELMDDDESGKTSYKSADKVEQRANVRDFVSCVKCHKPRCIYCRNALTSEQKAAIQNWKKSSTFRCCDELPLSVAATGDEEIVVESAEECDTEVSFHYFFRCLKYPLVCYRCGSADVEEIRSEIWEQFSTYHPVCDNCDHEGVKPRTKKKYERNVKPTI